MVILHVTGDMELETSNKSVNEVSERAVRQRYPPIFRFQNGYIRVVWNIDQYVNDSPHIHLMMRKFFVIPRVGVSTRDYFSN